MVSHTVSVFDQEKKSQRKPNNQLTSDSMLSALAEFLHVHCNIEWEQSAALI